MRKPRMTISFNVEELKVLHKCVYEEWGEFSFLFDKIDRAYCNILKKRQKYWSKMKKRT